MHCSSKESDILCKMFRVSFVTEYFSKYVLFFQNNSAVFQPKSTFFLHRALLSLIIDLSVSTEVLSSHILNYHLKWLHSPWYLSVLPKTSHQVFFKVLHV